MLHVRADVGTPAADRHDEALLAQQRDRLPRGTAGDPEFLLQLRLTGNRTIGQQLSRLDARPHDLGHLDVDRRRALRID